MINNELDFIKEVESLLKNTGNTELIYATAELEPFSNQQKPDLVLYPTNVPNKALFLEFKIAPANGFKDSFWMAFDEKKIFVKESSEIDIVYIFSTNVKVGDNIKSELEKYGIAVIDEAINPEILTSKINEYINDIK